MLLDDRIGAKKTAFKAIKPLDRDNMKERTTSAVFIHSFKQCKRGGFFNENIFHQQ